MNYNLYLEGMEYTTSLKLNAINDFEAFQEATKLCKSYQNETGDTTIAFQLKDENGVIISYPNAFINSHFMIASIDNS